MLVEVVTRMSLCQTSGHVFTLGGGAMSWRSKKQKLHSNVNYEEIVYPITINTKVLL